MVATFRRRALESIPMNVLAALLCLAASAGFRGGRDGRRRRFHAVEAQYRYVKGLRSL